MLCCIWVTLSRVKITWKLFENCFHVLTQKLFDLGLRNFTHVYPWPMEVPYCFGFTWVKGQCHMTALFEYCFCVVTQKAFDLGIENFMVSLPLCPRRCPFVLGVMWVKGQDGMTTLFQNHPCTNLFTWKQETLYKSSPMPMWYPIGFGSHGSKGQACMTSVFDNRFEAVTHKVISWQGAGRRSSSP